VTGATSYWRPDQSASLLLMLRYSVLATRRVLAADIACVDAAAPAAGEMPAGAGVPRIPQEWHLRKRGLPDCSLAVEVMDCVNVTVCVGQWCSSRRVLRSSQFGPNRH
jgi:hypothetical protein